MPLSLAGPVHSELVIKKSRFIGCVQPMADRAGAQKVVADLWAQHPGARHVCWSLLAGGQSAAVDDGEPSGTAGRPMLDVLRHQDLEGVLATVVRYFGGVKLGAGGLVRAYTDTVAQALLQAEKVPIVRLATLRCRVPYALEGLLRRELEAAAATLMAVAHGEAVELCFSLREEDAAALRARLAESGQGRIEWLNAPEEIGSARGEHLG
ncbi:IMPACT family protein [Thauera sp. WH-2]|uniref:IMPACT family protein n=1 Tax=Thauera sp. WH-2 TaxID=3401574 RepID=UPI003AAC70FD